MKVISISVLLVLVSGFLKSQDPQINLSNNNLYIEGTLGLMAHASFNYERRLVQGQKVSLFGRAGLGPSGIFFGPSGQGGNIAGVLLTGNEKRSHFELVTGMFIGWDKLYEETFYLPLIKAGYRFQKPEGGFLFRANVGLVNVGVSFGYTF